MIECCSRITFLRKLKRIKKARCVNGQLMTRIENGIPHDKSGTWTFEEINSRGLDQMARIRI